MFNRCCEWTVFGIYKEVLSERKPVLICKSNHMNTSVIKDLHYGWYLKIVSKSPLGAFRRVHSNITSRAFIQVPINYMTEKIANTRVLICSAVQIKTNDQLASSLSQSQRGNFLSHLIKWKTYSKLCAKKPNIRVRIRPKTNPCTSGIPKYSEVFKDA